MFRPRRARQVIYACVTLILATVVVGNLWLPLDGPGAWNIASRVALGAVALAIAYFLHRLASVRVVADEAGATVVNIVRARRLEWPQIVGVRLTQDDAWLVLDLAEGESLFAMGIQRAEGERAQRQAVEFARLVNEHTRTRDV